MITKTIKPLVKDDKVVGTRIQFRVFGLLVYEKILEVPVDLPEWGYEYRF